MKTEKPLKNLENDLRTFTVPGLEIYDSHLTFAMEALATFLLLLPGLIVKEKTQTNPGANWFKLLLCSLCTNTTILYSLKYTI